jgi:AraC family transcriptional activator of tynA and feaB
MTPLEILSTADQPQHRRLEYWNDLTSIAFTPLVSDPVDRRGFVGCLTRTRLGDIRVSEVRSDPATVRHSRQHVARAREALLMLCLQLDGVSFTRQQGRESVLHSGDFHLLDSGRPYEVCFQETNRMLVLSIPQHALARRMANPEGVIGMRVCGKSGVPGLLSSLLGRFWKERESSDERFLSPHFSEAILDLIASAYGGNSPAEAGTSIAVARREQVRGYIEAHLHEPTLTPAAVAQAVHLSARRLHQLFEPGGETVGSYILRRRLEECARAISDGSQRGRTVTEIAFLHGFNNASHFGRVFREHFGSTPTDYRRKNLELARAG